MAIRTTLLSVGGLLRRVLPRDGGGGMSFFTTTTTTAAATTAAANGFRCCRRRRTVLLAASLLQQQLQVVGRTRKTIRLYSTSLLTDAWPQLQERYHQIQNVNGEIDLLSHLPKGRQRSSNRAVVDNSKNQKQAAVLVLLVMVQGEDGPSLVLTRRSSNLSQHASELSFPGGHYEPEQDVTLVDTALREAYEELYYYPSNNNNDNDNESEQQQQQQQQRTSQSEFIQQVRILGQGTALPSMRGIPVTPILGIWSSNPDTVFPTPITSVWSGNPSEVDLVFTVSLKQLLAVETTHTLPPNDVRFQSTTAPLYPTPHGNIWGLTAYMIRPLLHQLYQPVFFPDNNAR